MFNNNINQLPLEIQKRLSQKLETKLINKVGQHDFLASTYVISQLNDIFGFGGWQREVTQTQIIHKGVNGKSAEVGAMAITRLTFPNGQVQEDVGVMFNSQPIRNASASYDTALKGAVSLSLTRASRALGLMFGNGLYMKKHGNFNPTPTQFNGVEEVGFNGLTNKQSFMLGEPLCGSLVKGKDTRSYQEKKNNTGNEKVFNYIPSAFIYANANRIFNYTWSKEIVELELLSEREEDVAIWENKKKTNKTKKQYKVVCQATVKITLPNGVSYTDTATQQGVGSIRANVYSVAYGGAVSKATTRAFRLLGNQFGNVLYQLEKGIFQSAPVQTVTAPVQTVTAPVQEDSQLKEFSDIMINELTSRMNKATDDKVKGGLSNFIEKYNKLTDEKKKIQLDAFFSRKENVGLLPA